MGLLSLGTPLDWSQVKSHCIHVRDHGIFQLLNIWKTHKDRTNDRPYWGDELEYMIVQLEGTETKLTLRQDEILDALISAEQNGQIKGVSFHQEYGRYMLEATPENPYTGDLNVDKVEKNMESRRSIAQKYLRSDEAPLTLTTYPLLGVGQFASPWDSSDRPVSESLFLPDNIINTHARFPTLTKNIRQRRGEKVDIRVPLYRDDKTDGEAACSGCGSSDTVYMDAMGFGMGSSCLQLTFQATDITEARYLYDQFVPFAPVMLALSAAAPLYRGFVSDQDVRWCVISAAVDDRTKVERGLEPPPEDWAQHTDNSSPTIPKSRYDSVDCYLSNNPVLVKNQEFYNDAKVVVNNRAKAQLEEAGMDSLLAQHFSHLFIRDPLVIFEELLHQDDTTSTDHFENIQSTNWQTVRFKPPPNESIGWRVEFRPMDVQISDFENAAFSVFTLLLTRVVLKHKLCFYMPISQVDLNMKTAHKRDAAIKHRFWFRVNYKDQDSSRNPVIKELTLDEIFNGSGEFEGIVPLITDYVNSLDLSDSTRATINRYMELVSRRASGELWTAARWIREFVTSHPDYKHDSVVSAKINYDLMIAIQKVTQGNWGESTDRENRKKGDAKVMFGDLQPESS